MPPQDGNKGSPDRTRAKLPPCATGPTRRPGPGPGRPGTAEKQQPQHTFPAPRGCAEGVQNRETRVNIFIYSRLGRGSFIQQGILPRYRYPLLKRYFPERAEGPTSSNRAGGPGPGRAQGLNWPAPAPPLRACTLSLARKAAGGRAPRSGPAGRPTGKSAQGPGQAF